MSTAEIRLATALSSRELDQAHALLAELVRGGAAIGWVEPPSPADVRSLLDGVLADARTGDAACAVALRNGELAGIGYWERYRRPTNRVHADLARLAVARDAQGQGIGRSLTEALIAAARAASIEQLTLDFRADNDAADALYTSLGFEQYGRLRDFAAFGERRYDSCLYALDLRATPSCLASRVTRRTRPK